MRMDGGSGEEWKGNNEDCGGCVGVGWEEKIASGDGDGSPVRYVREEDGMVELYALRYCCRLHNGGGTGPSRVPRVERKA